jgi:hypothetical protein
MNPADSGCRQCLHNLGGAERSRGRMQRPVKNYIREELSSGAMGIALSAVRRTFNVYLIGVKLEILETALNVPSISPSL